MLPEDMKVVRALADRSPEAARIFVTGEACKEYLGDAAVDLLLSINDTLYKKKMEGEPLFVDTWDSTIRMLRFEPKKVWGYFHPDMVVNLVQQESDRLNAGVDPWKMDVFDFYEEMIRSIKGKYPYSIPDTSQYLGDINIYFHSTYLSCLLLFGKPGYLDVPVQTYFAQPDVADWMRNVLYRELTAPEIGKLVELESRFGKVQALTNPEMNFAINLYERRKLDSTAAATFKSDE
jgi:hypothetical protein